MQLPLLNTSIDIPFVFIKKFLIAVFIFIIGMLVGTWMHNSYVLGWHGNVIHQTVAHLNLAKENNTAAWFSSMLLVLVALASVICFLADQQNANSKTQKLLNFGWIILACIFLVLSFDEMGSFHEMIARTPFFKSLGTGVKPGWFAFFALIGLVALFMLFFFLVKFKNQRWSFVFALLGLLLFLSNPLQEKYELEAWRSAPNPDEWSRPMFLLLFEEGSELFAVFFFLISFLKYSIKACADKSNKTLKGICLQVSINKKLIFYLIAAILVAAIVMFVIRFNALHMDHDDNGIPHNWFPSILSFITAFVTVAGIVLFKKSKKKISNFYFLLMLACIGISDFFGGYFYWLPFHFIKKIPIAISITLLLLLLTIIFRLSGKYALILIGYVSFIFFISRITREFVTASTGYFSIALMLICICIHLQNQLLKLDKEY